MSPEELKPDQLKPVVFWPDKQLSKVPDDNRSIIKARIQKWLRGRFQHAHKGRSRRRRHAPKSKTLLVIITTKERRLKPNWSF